MTALIAITLNEAVHLVTDGVVFPRAGDDTIKAFAHKVATAPHLSAAVAVSGPARLLHPLAELLNSTGATDLDDAVGSQDVGAAGAMIHAAGSDARVVIAGLSQRCGPAIWHLAGGRFDRTPANAIIMPEIDISGWTLAAEDGPAFDASMVQLVQMQRQAFPIGGFVALTTIRPDRIEQRVLHRWEDRVGDVLGGAAHTEGCAR